MKSPTLVCRSQLYFAVAAAVTHRFACCPIDFGYSSTFVETIECAEVETAAVRFLQSLDYSGLVEVEFKFDARTRRYNILDVNIRGWTWIGLGRRAGVDFAYLLWRLAMGETVTPCKGRPGVAWRHAARDTIAALQETRRRRLAPADYIGSLFRPVEFAVFAFDDPLPGLVDMPLLAARLIARRLPLALRSLSRYVSSRLPSGAHV